MPEKNKIGKAIRILREAKGFSAAKLADVADLTTSQLCMVEKGQRVPNVNFLTAISKALSVPCEVLLALSCPDEGMIQVQNKKSKNMMSALDKLQQAEDMLIKELSKDA